MSALLYRPEYRRRTYIAFGCAATLHLAAIALAYNKPSSAFSQSESDAIIGVIDPSPEAPVVEPPETNPNQSIPVPDNDAPQEESPRPVPVRSKNPKPISRMIGSAKTGPSSVQSFGLLKASAVYAPRPDYPYEARRQHSTGSGVVLLKVESSSGAVVAAQLIQSTGSPILDNSALSAFRRWRFQPNTVSEVKVPITYTLTGASY